MVQPADFNLPNHQLNDDAKLHWTDTCDVAPTNCNSNQQTQTAPSATSIIRRNSDTATDIHNGQHQVVTTVVVGTTVHDFITVTTADPDPNNPIPHGGDVFLQWFTNGVCDGEGGSVTQTVGPVDATGHFDATGFPQTPTVPGHYSFRAAYLGDGTYGPSTGGCEPLTVVDAKISIAPNATNEVGQPHTFTATLLKNAGDGAGFVAAAGEHVSVTLTDTNGASHTTATGSCTTAGPNTNASGQCTITFTSNAAGKVTGHASATLSVGGSAPFTRQTDGQAGNSGDAVKTFVDANIQITPNGTNPVGATHTFTGHVNINAGDGAGFVNAPNGTQISFTIDSGPGAFTSANPCTVGAGGSCTITLVSNVTGTTVVSAHTTVSVGGVSLTRHTNGTGANSGPATKLWADDTVRTDILNALNQVITTAVSGTVVHDNVQVAKAAGTPASVPNPTGSVIFHRYTTINCTGTATNQTVALTPGAPSTANSDGFAVTADMSYQAEYLGDANYPAHLGACEPLTVTPLPAPGIAIVKNPKSQTVAVGGTATFSITVTNIGNVTLTDVHVVDPLSPNCNRTKADIPALASMAPQAAVTYSCTRPNVRSAFNNVATAIGTPPTGPDVTASDTAPVKTRALVPKKNEEAEDRLAQEAEGDRLARDRTEKRWSGPTRGRSTGFKRQNGGAQSTKAE